MGSQAKPGSMYGPEDNHKDFWWGSVDVSDVGMAMCSFEVQASDFEMPPPSEPLRLRPVDIYIATSTEHNMSLAPDQLIGINLPKPSASRWLFEVGIDPDYPEKANSFLAATTIADRTAEPPAVSVVRYIESAVATQLPKVLEDSARVRIYKQRNNTAIAAVSFGLAPRFINAFMEFPPTAGWVVASLGVISLGVNHAVLQRQIINQTKHRNVVDENSKFLASVVCLDILNGYGVTEHMLGSGADDPDDDINN